MKKILVTGKNGLVGSNLKNHPYFKNAVFLSHDELDIAIKKQVELIVKKIKPEIIINCAAFTDVTKAELTPKQANLVNNIGAKNLAEVCFENRIKLIHFGTDFIFEDTGKEHFEDDSKKPLGVYAKTKLLGENAIVETLNDYLILRISWVWGDGGKNFISSLPKLFNQKPELKIVHNQKGKTTYVPHLIKALIYLIDNSITGIYHFANKGVCSRFDYAVKLKQVLQNNTCKLTPIEQDNFADKTPRPFYSVMNTSKIEELIDFEIPSYEQAIVEHYAKK